MAIVIIATYVSWYYNTIIAWAVFYFFSAMSSEVPWKSCNNSWNSRNNCVIYHGYRTIVNTTRLPVFKHYNVLNFTNSTGGNYSYIIEEIEDHSTYMTNNATKDLTQTATEEFFEYVKYVFSSQIAKTLHICIKQLNKNFLKLNSSKDNYILHRCIKNTDTM